MPCRRRHLWACSQAGSAHVERDRDTVSPHRAKVPVVRPERRAQRILGDVADTVTLGVALDDLGDLRVVSVRYPREQVMLDLVVEASHHPAEDGVARAEVDRRLDLVYRPDPPLGGELLGGGELGFL